MWYLLSDEFCQSLLLLSAVFLLYRVIKSLKRSVIDHFPYCKQCRYCLNGLGSNLADKKCPECDADLSENQAIIQGRRGFLHLKQMWLGIGVMLLSLAWYLGISRIPLAQQPAGLVVHNYAIKANHVKEIIVSMTQEEAILREDVLLKSFYAVRPKIVETDHEGLQILQLELIERMQSGQVSLNNVVGLIDQCFTWLEELEAAYPQASDHDHGTMDAQLLRWNIDDLLADLFFYNLMTDKQAKQYIASVGREDYDCFEVIQKYDQLKSQTKNQIKIRTYWNAFGDWVIKVNKIQPLHEDDIDMISQFLKERLQKASSAEEIYIKREINKINKKLNKKRLRVQ